MTTEKTEIEVTKSKWALFFASMEWEKSSFTAKCKDIDIKDLISYAKGIAKAYSFTCAEQSKYMPEILKNRLNNEDYLQVMSEIEDIKTEKRLQLEKDQEKAQKEHEEYLRETCSPEWYAYLMSEE